VFQVASAAYAIILVSFTSTSGLAYISNQRSLMSYRTRAILSRLTILINLNYILPKKYFLAFIFLFAISTPSWASYVVIGKIKASVCSGVVFQSCRFESVDAVGDSSGQLYEPARQYNSVSEFRAKDNQCWIRMKTGSKAVDALNAARRPNFFTKQAGHLIKISPDYLIFNCRRF
jgi:hypothetical protein